MDLTRPAFDRRDAEILVDRLKAREQLTGPLVGDFVYLTAGDLRRFTHDWGDELQTTIADNIDTSFYLGADGHMSFSGSLDPSIPKARLRKRSEVREASCWFFHHGSAGAYRGVTVHVAVSVWMLMGEATPI
jgi:hypothetical protein